MPNELAATTACQLGACSVLAIELCRDSLLQVLLNLIQMSKPETRESHLSSCPNIPESTDLGTDETNFQLLIWNLQDFPAALETSSLSPEL